MTNKKAIYLKGIFYTSLGFALICFVLMLFYPTTLTLFSKHIDVFDSKFCQAVGVFLFIMANLSFAWARSLFPKRYKWEIYMINRAGFLSICSAMFFLFAAFTSFLLERVVELRFTRVYTGLNCIKILLIIFGTLLIIFILKNLIKSTFNLLERLYLRGPKGDWGPQFFNPKDYFNEASVSEDYLQYELEEQENQKKKIEEMISLSKSKSTSKK